MVHRRAAIAVTQDLSDKPALDGLKVIDLSRILAGPWATQTLADLGADVIKIERPGGGDDTRSWGPPWFETSTGDRISAYFMAANRGKKSVGIDLTTPEGQELVRDLVKDADVLVENFKVGNMAEWGLDFETLERINPRLIYCSVTGFGQTGPYRHRPGYDFMIQGMGGLMSITGEPESSGGSGPQKVGVAVTDILTGLYSTIAILAALNERHRSGKGQYIDMALLDVVTASLANQASNYLVSGVSPGRLGNAHPNIVPYRTFQAADGHFIVATGNDAQFMRLCEVVGKPGLADDPLYASNALRVENRESLEAELQDGFHSRNAPEWLSMLEAAGVPCGPINSIGQMFSDPQVKARGMAIEIGNMPLVGSPIRLSRTPVSCDLGPPMPGEQTAEVLAASLGLGKHELEKLARDGVINGSRNDEVHRD